MSTQRGSSNTSSAKARRPNLSPYAQVAPPPLMSRSSRGAPSRTHVAVSGPPSSHGGAHPTVPPCYCPQCLAADKRRQALWHAPSPYLEDLTKRLVKVQPARRKLQLVPQLRIKATVLSPYEPRGYGRAAYGQPFRTQLQASAPPPTAAPPRRAPIPPPCLQRTPRWLRSSARRSERAGADRRWAPPALPTRSARSASVSPPARLAPHAATGLHARRFGPRQHRSTALTSLAHNRYAPALTELHRRPARADRADGAPSAPHLAS